MIQWGNVPLGAVLPFFFDSFAGATGASITLTGLAAADIEVYKGTSMTQRASDNGFTLLDTDGIDIDSRTGIHGFSIDTGDNTDAGFYAAGSFYIVVIDAVTIDSQTVRFIVGAFRLVAAESVAGKPKVDVDAWLGTAAATPTVAGVPEVDVTHWIGTAAATPTVAGVPEVDVTHFGGAAATTSSGRPEVNTSHAAGTAWNSGAIGAATLATDTITAAKIAANAITDTEIANGAITAAKFAAGAITATVIADDAIDAGSIAANAITSAKIAPDAITNSQIADAAITAAKFGTNAITATVIAPDAIGASELAVDAVTEIANAVAAPTAATIADAVWDEDATAHQTQGTFGQAIGDPGADSDTIWALANTNLDATVGSRATQTSVDDLPTNAELATALGTADDAVLAAIAALAIPTANQNADALLDRADAIETGLTVRQAHRLYSAAMAGKLSGAATTTNTFRNAVADSKARITATVDSDGNRTAITTDVT